MQMTDSDFTLNDSRRRRRRLGGAVLDCLHVHCSQFRCFCMRLLFPIAIEQWRRQDLDVGASCQVREGVEPSPIRVQGRVTDRGSGTKTPVKCDNILEIQRKICKYILHTILISHGRLSK